MSLDKLLEGHLGGPATQHADTLLEIAFLMTAVDGHLADEEQDAFRDLVGRLRGRPASADDVGALLERFVVASHSEGVDERLRTVAKTVPSSVRDLAYKLAMGFALVDGEGSPHEDELGGVLADTLGISANEAKKLHEEARVAFDSKR